MITESWADTLRVLSLPLGTHSCIGRKWCARADCARIGQAQERNFIGFEERAECVVALVEEVLNQPEYFHLFRYLISGVEIDQPIAGQHRTAVPFIPAQILAAHGDEIGSYLPVVKHRVFDTRLDPVRGN